MAKPSVKLSGQLLGGTARTLDQVDGDRHASDNSLLDLGDGLISRDGWHLVDDTGSFVPGDEKPPWVHRRACQDCTDDTFFGYGREPLPPHYAFGYWWSRYWNYSDDELRELAFQPRFTATASNVLYGYWSHDLGGHTFRDESDPATRRIDPELYIRWMQFGAWSPIMRTHTTKNPNLTKEPWRFAPAEFDALRATVLTRYTFLPYTCTMGRKAYDTGVSLVRPMYYAWPDNDEAYHGNAFARTALSSEWSKHALRVRIAPRTGSYPGMPTSRQWSVDVVASAMPASVTVDGVALTRSDDAKPGTWHLAGKDLTLHVTLPAHGYDQAQVVEVAWPANAPDVNGLAGQMRDVRAAVAWLKAHWQDVNGVPDDVSLAAQADLLIDYHPGHFAEEVAAFRKRYAQLDKALEQGGVPADMRATFKARLGTSH